jgi:hypothetical protein
MSIAHETYVLDDKTFLYLIRGLLRPAALLEARASILASEAAPPSSSLNPRAEIQGVAPDAVRLNECWYEIWREVGNSSTIRRV